MKKLIILTLALLPFLASYGQGEPKTTVIQYDQVSDSVKNVVAEHFFDFDRVEVAKLEFSADSVQYRMKFKARSDMMILYFTENGKIAKREVEEDYEEED